MKFSVTAIKESGALRISKFLKCFVFISLFCCFEAADTYSQGNLLMFPRRVVFEGASKSQDLTLANTGNDSATYIVSLVQMRMKEDGGFEQITTPDEGQLFADKYLRFYPRTVKLGPKKSQIIKIQLLKGASMEPGEYRSHIYFRAVPKIKPLGEAEAVTDSTTVSARLVPVFGITIPVIIRIGESNTSVTLSDLSFELVNDTTPKLNMQFNRTGSFSVFGDIVVNYVANNGYETKVANVKAIAVYHPNLVRRFQCDLERKQGIDYKSGKLKVVFTTPIDTKSQKLAEADLLLK